MTTTTRPTTDEPVTIPCAPWCTYQDPTDEACLGPEHRVTLSMHDREQYTDGSWRDDYVTAYVYRSRVSRFVCIHLEHSEEPGVRLTAAEARQVAAALLDAADELDGSRRPSTLSERLRAARAAGAIWR